MAGAEIPKTLLIVNKADGDWSWAERSLRASYPDAAVITFAMDVSKEPLREQWRKLRELRCSAFDFSFLPINWNIVETPRYWLTILVFLGAGLASPRFLIPNGKVWSAGKLLENLCAVPLQPLLSLISLLLAPYYLVTEVIRKFVLSPEDAGDPFVGFGKRKGVGGLIYWLFLTRKTRRYGLFGFAHDAYMGIPLSIHNWPVATIFLRLMGFRNYAYLSAAMLSAGLAIIMLSAGHAWLLFLILLILLSSYSLFNLYISTWEILAWGFGFLSFTFWVLHLPAGAGFFLALALLSHPGVSLLLVMSIVAFMIRDPRPLLDLIVLSSVAAAVSLWWAVPYRRCRAKLGRSMMINRIWNYPYCWNVETIYQFLIYATFLLVTVSADHPSALGMLILPLVVLYCNVKVRLIFSKYTVYNYLLFTGAVYTSLYPSFLSVLVYLMMIYTSKEMIWSGLMGRPYQFDLSPVRLGETEKKIKKVFADLRAGRIAFELETSRSHPGWGLMAVLGYILADQDLELLNVGYAEIGDYRIFDQYVRFFNAQAPPEMFDQACRDSGVKYMVAFTENFTEILNRRGYRLIQTISDLHLSETPDDRTFQLSIFEMPWKARNIEPDTHMEIQPNRIQIKARTGGKYLLRYSAFPGWRAYQGGNRIPIVDAHPGMLIESRGDDDIVLKYSFRHYWL